MDNKEKLISIGAASEYLGISIDTLRRWEKYNKITAYRSPGGHRYFKIDDLDKLFGKKYERSNDSTRIPKITVSQKENNGLEKPEDEKTKSYIPTPPVEQITPNLQAIQATPDIQPISTSILTPSSKDYQMKKETASTPIRTTDKNLQAKIKKQISWSNIVIIGLVLFTLVDVVLLIIFIYYKQTLVSPVP